jgi:hypothetical protein
MAENGLQRLQKLAGNGTTPPIKEFPKMPEALLKFGPPEFRAAMLQWGKEIDEWRKSLVVR